MVWETMRHLSLEHHVTVVGSEVDTAGLENVTVRRVRAPSHPGFLSPLLWRRAAAPHVAVNDGTVVVSYGSNCPVGDVVVVQSVHRAWLELGRSVRYGPIEVPRLMRYALPRHQVLLTLEASYFASGRFRRVVAVSDNVAADLRRLYDVPDEQIVVIPNGYSADQCSPERSARLRHEVRAELGLRPHDVALLLVANEWHRKGLKVLLDAVARLDEVVQVVLVGRMPPDAYAGQIARLGLADRVRYCGPTNDVGRYYAGADLFVMPTQYEAFGSVIVEALASGLPVITTARAGAAVAVQPGVNGLLQDDPFDADELVGLLAQGLDPATRDRWRRAAAASVSAYEWSSVVDRMRTVIAEVGAAMDRSASTEGQAGPTVLRITRSAVVPAWRARDLALRRAGADVTLIGARHWNEAGRLVHLDAGHADGVIPARTWGSHPNLFVYDPRPLWRALRAVPVEIVDAHEEPCSVAAAEIGLLRRLLRPTASLVLYSAQNIFKRYPWPIRMAERVALGTASGVYVCNEEAGRILRRKGFIGALAVVPLGVDISRFAPATSCPGDQPAGSLRLAYLGRLEARKGIHVILDAMAEEPQWSLDIVGEGEHRPVLEELVAARSLRGRVQFRGHVRHEDLPELYRSADVVVVPSLPTAGWEEQFCRVAVEAMASGVPVVASASGALPEVVGDAGVLFLPGDPLALHDVLHELACHPDLRQDLGRRGRARSSLFSWEAVATGHRALYDAVRQ